MSLSDDEQAWLSEIESLTAAADPQFARRLDLTAAHRRRQHLRWACWVLFAAGAVLLGIGASAARGFISIGAVLSGVGWTTMAWSGLTACSLRTGRA